MRLEKASYKAVKYACLKFHYAKTVPIINISYSVFNGKNQWCGVICFGNGANYNLGKKYELVSGQFLELTRVALNGLQESTSKCVSLSIKMIKKNKPLVNLLISYADKGQNHIGVIYQATNWIYVDETESSGIEVFYKGKWRHDRIQSNIKKEIWCRLEKRKKSGKYKYLYPLNKNIRKKVIKYKKDYPKNAIEV
tara:strand:- start:205 stop:789 length:585 start_codon:yes stop_codon:yes gene_type:complete